MAFFKEIEELKFNDGVLLNTDFKIEALKSVHMMHKFDTSGTPLFLFLMLAFILGFLTYGLTWLYLLWRSIAYFKNLNKSYIFIEFENQQLPSNITEDNYEEDSKNLMIYKGLTTLVDEKYNELKTLAANSNGEVSFKKEHSSK